MICVENILEVGTEVFILSSQLFGVIVSNDNLNYYVAPSEDSLDTPIICSSDDVIKVLPVGTKVQIKETAFCGVILGDDRDLPVANLDGFNYFIGEEGNNENKLFVHHEDICIA